MEESLGTMGTLSQMQSEKEWPLRGLSGPLEVPSSCVSMTQPGYLQPVCPGGTYSVAWAKILLPNSITTLPAMTAQHWEETQGHLE